MIQRRDLLNLPLATAAGLLPTAAQAQVDPAIPRTALETAIWRSPYDDTRVWGYVDRHSVAPGEKFDLMLSTGPALDHARGHIEIFRIGAYPDGDRKLAWRSERVDVARQPVQITAAAVGTGWTASIEQIPTGDWISGYYAIDFVDDGDGLRNQNVAFIVATPTGPDPDILIGLSSNTWQAYNEWGGYSLYVSDFIGTNAQTVSFDRPCAPDFFEYDYYIATFVEDYAQRHGLRVGYATNFDLYRDPSLVERCRLLSRAVTTSTGRSRSSMRCTGGFSKSVVTRSSWGQTPPTGRFATVTRTGPGPTPSAAVSSSASSRWTTPSASAATRPSPSI